jgi:type II secretory pathway component PulF
MVHVFLFFGRVAAGPAYNPAMTGHSDARRGLFYRQLAGLEAAGIPVREALKVVEAPDGVLRGFLEHLRQQVAVGGDLGQACLSAPGLRPFEKQIIAAAVRVGRAPEAWRELAEYFESRAASKREIIGQMIHPAIVLHLCFLLPTIVVWFKDGFTAYLKVALPGLFILWGVVVGGFFLLRLLRDSVVLDGILWHVPGIAGLYRLNMQRTALSVLRAAMAAGLMADTSFEAAADACQGVLLRRQLREAARSSKQGQGLRETIRNLTCLPSPVRALMATAAESGTLPETLARVEVEMAAQAKHKQKVFNTLLGTAMFLVAAAVVAYKVVTFFQGYAKMLGG